MGEAHRSVILRFSGDFPISPRDESTEETDRHFYDSSAERSAVLGGGATDYGKLPIDPEGDNVMKFDIPDERPNAIQRG